jgi:hypothetical protein
MLCYCVYKEFIKLTTGILGSIPIGPISGLLPGFIEKPEEWSDFEFNRGPIEFSTTPRLGPDMCYDTECSLEVHYPLLSELARIRDNLGWETLISQCIEESIKSETLKKWMQSRLRREQLCPQVWLWHILE